MHDAVTCIARAVLAAANEIEAKSKRASKLRETRPQQPGKAATSGPHPLDKWNSQAVLDDTHMDRIMMSACL